MRSWPTACGPRAVAEFLSHWRCHAGWVRGQPPRTTLTRTPPAALNAATRCGLSASEVPRRRYGSAEAAPAPTRLPARQIRSRKIRPLAERVGRDWGVPSRDPYLLRRLSKAETRISWLHRDAAKCLRVSVVPGGHPPVPPGNWPAPGF